MKKVLLFVAIVLLCGCQDLKFWGSSKISTLVGLKRHIKVCSPLNGNIINEYDTKSKIAWSHNKASFFNLYNKRIDIYGDFIMVVEESK